MKRKLILGERIMYADALTAVNCVFTVKINGAINHEGLRTAANKIQQKHPLLRMSITNDNKGRPYFTSNTEIAQIPIRVVERNTDIDWQLESEAEWKLLFDQHNNPLARIVWIRSATVSELLLVCPHCICDGTTMVTLMRELLQILDQPDMIIAPYTPFNAIEELIPQAILNSKKNRLKGKVFSVLARIILAFKSNKSILDQGKSYMLHWKLDKDMTTALVSSCKTEHSSVHAALCVAFLEAFKEVKGNEAKGQVICPADIRQFVPEIKNDNMFAFAPIVELSIANGPDLKFWTKARLLKEDLTDKIAAMNVHEMLMMSEFFHSSVKWMVKHLRTSTGTHDITLSNMGRLDIPEHYLNFEAETIYSPSVAFPWKNPNTLVISTFRGQMDIVLSSNESSLTLQEAQAIKEKTIALLTAEMAIPQY